MKKLLVLLAFSVILFNPVYCQKNSIRIFGGKTYGVQKLNAYARSDSNIVYHDSTVTTSNTKNSNLTLGDGLYLGAAYAFHPVLNILLEIEGSWYHSKSFPVKYVDYYYIPDQQSYVDYKYCDLYSGDLYMLRPQIIVRYPVSKFYPYLKCGVTVAYCTMTRKSDNSCLTTLSGYYPYSSMQTTLTYKSEAVFGFQFAPGIEYKFDKHSLVFVEILYSGITYTPVKSEYTRFILSGNNNLGNMTVSEKEFEYCDQNNSGTVQDPNLPTKALKITFPFNNIAFTTGIRIEF
ncbi:MAG: outer membrane beta-barrel protein [Bacteroidia bacterium]|nr:outer membrane beta-barrel protein [Bacteroidia bacterium]